MKITLAVTAWNDEKVIKRFLEHHIPHVDEVICSDDASTDNTPNIIKEYADKSILSTVCNYSCEYYRQKLMDLASNDWVLVMDSDQFIEFSVIDKLRQFAEDGDKNNIHAYDFELETIGYEECQACPKKTSRQVKFVNRKFVRWSIFPHGGAFLYNGDMVGGNPIIGKIWHLMKEVNCDHVKHKKQHILRMYRWIDVVRLYMKTYTSDEYTVDRDRCRGAFKERTKILIENTTYDCSRDENNLIWIEDDDELWEHLKSRGRI